MPQRTATAKSITQFVVVRCFCSKSGSARMHRCQARSASRRTQQSSPSSMRGGEGSPRAGGRKCPSSSADTPCTRHWATARLTALTSQRWPGGSATSSASQPTSVGLVPSALSPGSTSRTQCVPRAGRATWLAADCVRTSGPTSARLAAAVTPCQRMASASTISGSSGSASSASPAPWWCRFCAGTLAYGCGLWSTRTESTRA
mmetsp:Transcript_91010/g.257111  ORF Transcript_91010/g.257111 Transcript_91010/m.257111 type:complete len:203 (-) Transcript_91010:1431-2039(-)